MDSRRRSGDCSGRWHRALRRLAGRQEPPLWWQTSEALSRAVAATGLKGLRFELIAVGVESEMLTLTFEPLQPVPDQLQREAARALRAVVGLTLPAVASSMRSMKVEVGDSLQQLILGDGVPLPNLTLRCGAVHAGPLRVTSEEADGCWYVTVGPFVSFPMGSLNYSRQTEMQNRIFRMLIPAFAPLTYTALTLGG